MSTEVEQQQPAPAEAPTTTAEETASPAAETTPNGESKTEEKKQKVKKEPEPPKNPKEDFTGWLKQQNNKAVHKADYLLLSGIISKAYPEESENKPTLPTSGYFTKREFLNHLQDGTVLANFANALKAGSVEQIKEGEDAKTEENQKANIEAFIAVAKEFIPEEQLFTYEELKKGKEQYEKIFYALFQLLFKVEHPEFDQFIKEVGETEPENLYNKLVDRFTSIAVHFSTKLRKPFNRSNSQVEQPAEPATEQNGTNGVHTNGTTETTHEENGVPNGTKTEEKKEEAPAIAAN